MDLFDSNMLTSEKVQEDEVFDDLYVKKLLSLIGESGRSAKSYQYPGDFFGCSEIMISGCLYSFSTVEYKEGIIYTSSPLDNKTHLSWTNFSTGIIPALYESESSQQFAAGVKKLTSPANSKKERQEKALYLSKFLQNSALPELQNHPVRKKLMENQNSCNFCPKRQIDNNKIKKPSNDFSIDNPSLSTVYQTPKPQIPNQFKHPKKNPHKNIPKKSNSLPRKLSNAYKTEPSEPASIWRSCRFCLKNGEPKELVTSHFTRSSNGNVTCPILRRYVCEICGATGSYSHTRKYCPFYNPRAYTDPDYNRIANALMAVNLN
ncbi:hypothetical protein HUJ04_010086 [Dendroctonus ponderosae]|uniref:Nanos-type domain-containing protein n=1 Tax=Dendroctonus ponderosae TaxID=77166 RepID=A0AAR5Q212_DENPD|nr:hypothetical protein HUJ04_010084 [Dendroctonus ponderosae]KAH1020420.1 hypothetical protein HUJ04_010086 [Dendroctonus ponderosae]KAH1027531.1 hypothetical protein HUJ05_001020 [Dendroctonus ponderosae]